MGEMLELRFQKILVDWKNKESNKMIVIGDKCKIFYLSKISYLSFEEGKNGLIVFYEGRKNQRFQLFVNLKWVSSRIAVVVNVSVI